MNRFIGKAILTTLILTGCTPPTLTKLRPVHDEFVPIATLLRTVECELYRGINTLAQNPDISWIRKQKIGVDYELEIVDTQGFNGNLTIAAPVAAGLLTVGGSANKSRRASRKFAFALIYNADELKPCPTGKEKEKDEKIIQGSLGLYVWQTELTRRLIADNKLPETVSFSASFDVNTSGGLTPKFSNISPSSSKTGAIGLSGGRKAVHSITVVAEKFQVTIDAAKKDKSKTAKKTNSQRNSNLEENLKQRVLIDALRRSQ